MQLLTERYDNLQVGQNEYATLKDIVMTYPSAPLIFESLSRLYKIALPEIRNAITDIFQFNQQISVALGVNESSVLTFTSAFWFFELKSVEDITEHRESIISCFDILKNDWSCEEINRIFDSISGLIPDMFLSILKRYHQLSNTGAIDTVLEKKKLFKIACCIEQRIKTVEKLVTGYFKKELINSSRTMAYIADLKSFYIVLKEHFPNAICEKGISKKMTVAICVPDDTNQPTCYVAQCVNLTTNVNNCRQVPLDRKEEYNQCIKQICEQHEYLLDEFAKHKTFSGNRGIWPLLGYMQYTKVLPNYETIPKAVSFSPLARCDLWAVITGKVKLTTEQFVAVAELLTCGLDYLHSNGYIHGDLKPENALLGFVDGEVIAGINDFGLYYIPDKEELPRPWTYGYYGSKGPTPPELFANKNFAGDPYKVEIWAFGCLLFSVFLKGEPAWCSSIRAAWKNEKIENKVSNLLYKTILLLEETRTALVEMDKRTLYDECLLFIYDMIRLDPVQRLNTKELLQKIYTIKQLL